MTVMLHKNKIAPGKCFVHIHNLLQKGIRTVAISFEYLPFFRKTLNLQLVLYSPSACISVKTTHFLYSINATQQISLQDKSIHLNTYVSINLKNIYIFMSLKQDELLDLIVSHRTRTCGDYDGMHKTAAVIK